MTWVRLALVGLTLATFGVSLSGDFVWDDNPLIRDNAFVTSWRHLGQALSGDFWEVSDPAASTRSGYYRPVVKAAYVVQYQLSGGRPWLFHAVNLALHVAAVLLLFAWLMRRLGPQRGALPGAALAAAVFAVHPSRPESVAWISGSTDLWMGVFVLLGLWAFEVTARRGARIGLTATAFILAILSKEAALVVPVALVLDVLLRGGTGGRIREALVVLGWSVVAVAARLVYAPLRNPELGPTGGPSVISRAAATLWFLVIRSAGLSPPSAVAGELPQREEGAFLLPAVWIAGGLLTALALAGAALWLWRSPGRRPFVADLVWFVVPLAPVLNLVPMKYSFLSSNRFLYLPLVGLCAVLARGLGPHLVTARPLMRLVPGAVILTYAVLSLGHTLGFRTDTSLWSYEREANPASAYAAEMHARALWSDGVLEDAAAEAAAAARLADAPSRRLRAAVLYASIVADDPGASAAELAVAAAIFDGVSREPFLPFEARLGDAAVRIEDAAAARASLLRSNSFLTQRAILLARSRRWAEAERQFEALVQERPDSAERWLNLARLQAWRGDFGAALATLGRAQGRMPAARSLTDFAAMLRRHQEAIAVASAGASREVARASAFLELGAPELALEVLASAAAAGGGAALPVAAVRLQVQALVLQGEYEAAAAALAGARRAHGADPELAALERQLAEAQAR